MDVDLTWRYCLVVGDRKEHISVGDSILEGQNPVQAVIEYEEYTRAVLWRAELRGGGRVLFHRPVNTEDWDISEEIKQYWRKGSLIIPIDFICKAFSYQNRLKVTDLYPFR